MASILALEESVDRGAWQAAVRGVANSHDSATEHIHTKRFTSFG